MMESIEFEDEEAFVAEGIGSAEEDFDFVVDPSHADVAETVLPQTINCIYTKSGDAVGERSGADDESYRRQTKTNALATWNAGFTSSFNPRPAKSPATSSE